MHSSQRPRLLAGVVAIALRTSARGAPSPPPAVAVQFVVNHLAHPKADGEWVHLLPPSYNGCAYQRKGQSQARCAGL